MIGYAYKYMKENLLGAVAHVIVGAEKFLNRLSVVWTACDASSMAKFKFKFKGLRTREIKDLCLRSRLKSLRVSKGTMDVILESNGQQQTSKAGAE